MYSSMKAKMLNIYIFLVDIAAVILLAYAITHTNFEKNSLFDIVLFALVYWIIEMFPVFLPRGASITVGIALNVAILYFFNPPAAILSVFIGECLNSFTIKNKNIFKILFNIGQFIISISLAAFAKLFFINLWSLVPATIISAIIFVVLNIFLVSIALAMAQNLKLYDIWMINYKWVVPNFLALTPMGILMAKIYEAWGALGILMFILPLMLARHSFKLYMDTRQMYLDTVQALVTAIEAKDLYTKGHSERVAEFAVETARELDWPEHKIETLRYMALLHDIDKIAIPDVILNKSTRLSPQEYNRIKDHALVGAEILKQVKNLGDAYLMVRYHHERMDGSGYPDGLRGEEIPMGARIIAVADCFDAMTSNRVYRAGRSPREAIQELQKCGGAELDSQVVQAFVQAWEKRLAPKWEKQILTEIETGAARGEIAAAQAEE
ncbi:HDIG domain-containing protein [Carboxydocella sporoproducens DSM 16521]|uniref:HDIG domain-containing protein n=2 Tax=Carboxydocella TaxID=178898 RepID=A0A1T4MD40_9FIRM|nr:metal dependent phosphohydrolase [Carboxydocella thermautotrophica]SJZ64863.1 HDIG domain-containing protein [Carboxydocella sporoproducens DSM 16521]